jgi:hypothetical protein
VFLHLLAIVNNTAVVAVDNMAGGHRFLLLLTAGQ